MANKPTYEELELRVRKLEKKAAQHKLVQEEKKRLEAQLQQAHKMETLGTLASGVAHEFYNIIGIIIGNTELALYEIMQGRSAQHNLEEVLNACLRAEDVVTQILTFSRHSEQEKRPLLVNLVVQEAIKLLRATLPTTIQIRQDIESPSSTIIADPTQIQQVLMNLCTNAAHAMREKGGELEVSLMDVDLDAATASGYPDLNPGPYVRLTVGDKGHGIEPEIIERIFDPYFTSKVVNEGTGIGLAVVFGIVKGHGGVVTVESEVGKGTTFHVFFPRLDEKVAPKSEADTQSLLGNERILFVDDEQAIVNMAKKMLEVIGYEVVAKASSTEALEVFRAEQDNFDLVITDQIMPHMTGETLAKELMRIRADIPVILCTGHGESMTEDKAKAMGIREFLMKPVTTRDIAEAIRRVLDKDRCY